MLKAPAAIQEAANECQHDIAAVLPKSMVEVSSDSLLGKPPEVKWN